MRLMILLLMLISSVASAQTTQPADYPALRKMLAELKAEVESLRKENASLTLENQSLKRQLTSAREPAEAHVEPLAGDDPESFKVGYRGWKSATVKQVVDENNALVEVRWEIERARFVPSRRSNQGTFNPAEAGQLGTGGSVRKETEIITKDVWLTDFPTASLVDEQRIGPIKIEIFDTHTYDAIVGSKTVLKGRPI